MKKNLTLLFLIIFFNMAALAGEILGADGYYIVWWPGNKTPEQCKQEAITAVQEAIASYPEFSVPHDYARLAVVPKVTPLNSEATEYRFYIGEQHPIQPGEKPGDAGFISRFECYYITQRAMTSSNQKVTDTRPTNETKACGSVIDFKKKIVIESIPIEGTNFSINYSSELNPLINANRKISNVYNFFYTLNHSLKVEHVNSLTGQMLSSSDYSYPSSGVSDDFILPSSSTLWVNGTFTSTAKITTNLYATSLVSSFCWFVEYPDPNNPGQSIFVENCEVGIGNKYLVDSNMVSAAIYHPEVWGMHGWTLSEHHYFEKESKTLFAGFGERIQYADFKQINDPNLGNVNILISKYNNHELFIFDQNGRHLETRDAVFGHIIHKFSYDENNRLLDVSDRFNSKTRFIYIGSVLQKIISPYGVETKFEVAQNRIVKSTDEEQLSYNMSYDNDGLLTAFKSINGVETVFTYNQDGEFTKEEKNNGLLQSFTASIVNGLTEFTKSVNFGLARKVVNQVTQGGIDVIELDENNNEIMRTSRFFYYNTFQQSYSGEKRTQSFGYSAAWGQDQVHVDQNKVEVTESGQNITDTQQFIENNSYEDNNVLSLIRRESYVSTQGQMFATTYSKADNSIRTNDVYGVETKLELNNNLVSRLSRIDKFPTDIEYDDKGRLIKIKKGSQFETFSYNENGYLSTTNNNKNQLTKFIRNKKGQLLTKVLPNQDSIKFEYTAGGEVKKITAPNGQVHNFQMSLGDYVTQAITPNSKATAYEYDSDKRLTKVNKPSGKSLNYEYEPGKADLKRIVTSNGVTLINSRDTRSRITSISSADNVKTDITWASNKVRSQTWYDNGQLIAKLSNNFAENQFKIKSIYLNDDLVASYSYQNGVLRSIDNLGFVYNHEFGQYYHIQRITNNSGFSISYTEEDTQNGEEPEQLTSAQVYDGPEAQLYVTLKRAYDNFGQATEFTTTTLNQSTGIYNTYFSLMPIYDSNNRLVQINKTRKSFANGQEVNSIDFVNQYLYPQNSNNNVKTYQQSMNVNHTQSPIKRTVASHNNDDQLTKLQGSINRDYKYNEDGELSEMTNCYGTTTYEYDSFGNLKTVNFPGGKIVEYKVDAFNRRFKKLVNGQVSEYYLWYDQIRLAAILDGNKNPKAIYVYGSESENVPGYVIKDGKTYKIIHDPGTQSVRYIVDSENAMIIQESEYDEHGNIMKQTNAGFQPLGFAGGLYDADTGFVRFGARDYDPKIGRWTTKDPIGFGGGDTNLYAYVGGNPMSYVDPSGLDAELLLDPKTMHSVIAITDPNSKSGKTFYDFGPGKDGLGLLSPVNGVFYTTDSYEGLTKRASFSLTAAQDTLLRSRAKALGDSINSGKYKYTLIPGLTGTFGNQSGKNCFSFTSDVCKDVCK